MGRLFFGGFFVDCPPRNTTYHVAMASKIKICNMALSLVGVSQKIDDIDEASKEAQECNLWYDQVRDSVLRDASWGFASKYQTLVEASASPSADWDYQYRLPSDFLRATWLTDGERDDSTPIPYALGADSDGAGVIFTNQQSPVILKYVYVASDESRWPSDFVVAMAWALGAAIAGTLADNPAWSDRAMKGYQMAIRKALANMRNEEQPEKTPEAEWIRGRQ